MALMTAFFLTSVLNYAFAILMSWLLPVGRYGMLSVVQTILLLGTTVVGAGFPWALARAIPRQPAADVNGGSFRVALAGNLLVGIGLGGSLVAATVYGWLPLGAGYQPLILLTSATILLQGARTVFSATFQGLFRFDQWAISNTSEVVIKFVCGTVLVLLGAGALGAVAGFLVGTALSTVLSAAFLRDFRFWRGRSWGEPAVYTGVGAFFVGVFSLAVLVNVDTVGLKLFSAPASSDELVGQYQAAVTLSRIPTFVGLALFSAVFPYLARHPAHSTMGRTYATLALKYTFLFIVPLDVILMVSPIPVIRIFYASAYDPAARPLAVAAFGTILLTLIQGATTLLQAAGRLRITVIVLPAAVALELVALWWLVPRFDMVGAALALIVAGTLSLCSLLPAIARTFRLRLPAPPIVRYGLALGTLAVALHLAPHSGRLPTVAGITAAGAIYAVTLALLGLLTPRDIQVLAGGLGPRLAGSARWIGALVERLNRLNLAGRAR